MDTKTYVTEGTAKVRRAALRQARRMALPVVVVKDPVSGGTTGRFQPVYLSHQTTIPPVAFGRDSRYRRASTPWRKRMPQKPGTLAITCRLVPVVEPEPKA